MEMDKLSAGVASEQDDLNKILRASVPGLVSKSHRHSGQIQGNRHIAFEAPAAGHKLLVEPSVFNISILLPPSIHFLNRLRDIVPSDADIAISTLTSFLDEFIVNVFNPQLDETVAELFTQSFNELDTFQQDPHWANLSRRPIFKVIVLLIIKTSLSNLILNQGTSTFITQITAFCQMLATVPEDQTFIQLIITQLAAYHDKCSAWYTGKSIPCIETVHALYLFLNTFNVYT